MDDQRLEEIAREAGKRTGRHAYWQDRARVIKAAIREALSSQEEELRQLKEDAAEARQLRDRLSDILTQTANVLKGDPGPLVLHGWSDLPDVARSLREERDSYDEAHGVQMDRAEAAEVELLRIRAATLREAEKMADQHARWATDPVRQSCLEWFATKLAKCAKEAESGLVAAPVEGSHS
jgi:hypothetical protein